MIQIVYCSCIQRKLRAGKVAFYNDADKKSYDSTDKTFVAPCRKHPYFNERICTRFTDIACYCEKLAWGRYYNYKVLCFNISFLADKIKVEHYFDIASTIEMIPIETYLTNIKSMLFFYFCRKCFKVICSQI